MAIPDKVPFIAKAQEETGLFVVCSTRASMESGLVTGAATGVLCGVPTQLVFVEEDDSEPGEVHAFDRFDIERHIVRESDGGRALSIETASGVHTFRPIGDEKIPKLLLACGLVNGGPGWVENPVHGEQSRGGSDDDDLVSTATRGDLEDVIALVEGGADIDERDLADRTPLMAACWSSLEVVRYLLEQGADVDAVDEDGRNALMNAAEGATAAVVDLLVEHGADIESRGPRGWTPLMLAASEDNLETAEALLRHGASIEATDDDGMTPLLHAAEGGSSLVAELLLKSGANPAATDEEGRSALDIARAEEFEDIAPLLKWHGVEATAPSADETPESDEPSEDTEELSEDTDEPTEDTLEEEETEPRAQGGGASLLRKAKLPFVLLLLAGAWVVFGPLVGTGVGKVRGYHDVVMERLRSCPLSQELLGDDIGVRYYGLASWGRAFGAGRVNWSLPVSGTRASGTYRYSATRYQGTWRFEFGSLRVGDERVDLLYCRMDEPVR